MMLTEASTMPPAEERSRFAVPVAVPIVAALLIAVTAAVNWIGDLSTGMVDPDSQLRLVQVREFLDGRSWYDMVQPRIMPPDGSLLHWSRLLDAVLAALVAGLSPLVGREGAEYLVVALWPPLLLLPLMVFAALAAMRVGGRRAGEITAFLIALSPAVGTFFRPGFIDHHNVQVVILAAMVAALVRADDGWRPGALAGLAAALSIAVGLETVLFLAIGAGGLALLFVLSGARWRAGLAGFGIGFGAGVPLLMAATVDPSRWLVPVCDQISPVYAGAAVIAGFGVAAVAALPVGRGGSSPADALVRGGLVGLVGVAVLAFVGLVHPACLAGPYSEIDPRLGDIWLNYVSEAQSIVQLLREEPYKVPVFYVGPVLGLLAGVWCLRIVEPRGRAPLAILIALSAGCLAVGMVQVRGMVLGQFAAAMVGGVFAAVVLEAPLRGSEFARRFAWVPLAPYLWVFAVLPFSQTKLAAAENRIAGVNSCREDLLAGLADRPAGLVAAPGNQATFLLANTPHSVLAAPYHRNAAGMLAGYRLFTTPTAEVRAVLHGARYVALCLDDVEIGFYGTRAPDGFAADLVTGKLPDWLTPILRTQRTLLFEVTGAPDPETTGSVAPPRLRPTLDP